MCGRVDTGIDSARREPRLEHILALARGLEVASAELVVGRESEARQGQALLCSPEDPAEARLSEALQGRDHAWGLARWNFDTWAGAQMWDLHLKGQVDEGTAWISRLVGANVGADLTNYGG